MAHRVCSFTVLIAVIEFLCAFQTVPFGVLCFLPSYKALEKFTSRWRVKHLTFCFNYTHNYYNSHIGGLPSLWRLLEMYVHSDAVCVH